MLLLKPNAACYLQDTNPTLWTYKMGYDRNI